MVDAISGVNPNSNINPLTRVGQTGGVWRAQRAAMPEVPVQPVRPITPVVGAGAKAEPVGLGLPMGDAADLAELNVRQNLQPYQGEQILATSVGGAWLGERAGSTAIPGELLQLANSQAGMDKPAAQLSNAEDAAARLRISPFKDEEEQAEMPKLPGSSDKEAEEAKLPGASDDEEDEGGLNGAQEEAEEGRCKTCEERKYQDGSNDAGVSFKTPTRIDPSQVASAVRGHEMEHVYREQAKAKQEGRKVVSQTVTLHTAICPECGKVYISGGTTRTATMANNNSQAEAAAASSGKDNNAA